MANILASPTNNTMNLKYQDRINNPQNYGVIDNPDGSISTHLMAAEIDENGQAWAFPTIVQDGGKLRKFEDPFDAMEWNKAHNNAKQFDDINQALDYSKNYKTPEFNAYYDSQQNNKTNILNRNAQNALQNPQPTQASILGQSPIGRFNNALGIGNRADMAFDTLPISGEIRSLQRMIDALQTPPNAGDYINDGQFNDIAYGKAMQSHGGLIGLEALGAVPAIGYGARGAGALGKAMGKDLLRPSMVNQQGMVAYHGSPHKFDKFQMDKIGTGEGAQAYGHGLYVAENKGVAGNYQKQLTDYKIEFDGKNIDPSSKLDDIANQLGISTEDAEGVRRLAIRAFNDPQKKGIEGAKDYYKSLSESHNEMLQDALAPNSMARQVDIDNIRQDILEFDRAIQASDKYGDKIADSVGNLYEVDLPDSKINQMLDFDAPLKDQPDIVKKLHALANDPDSPFTGNYLQDLRDALQPFEMNAEGGSILRLLGQDEIASEALRKHGIPGIKYYDGGSRSAGSGTRNFVVFDENDLPILSRNGEPIAKQGLLNPQPAKGMADKVDKRTLMDRRVNKLFDNATERRQAPRREMAVRDTSDAARQDRILKELMAKNR